MPLKNRTERKKIITAKVDNIKFLTLVNEINKFKIIKSGEEIINVISVDIDNKTISVTHPDYELFDYNQKMMVNNLITRYKFYIQWKFFTI